MIAYVLVGISCFVLGMLSLWAYDRIAYNRMMRFTQAETDWEDDSESWDPAIYDEDEVWDGPENP